jgi:hypothetical protein
MRQIDVLKSYIEALIEKDRERKNVGDWSIWGCPDADAQTRFCCCLSV